MMDMSCADRDGGTLLLRDIQSFNEFWKQMVPPKETQVDCCPYTCTQYNQFLFAPDGKFHTVGPTHYNTFLQVGKKILSSQIGHKESAPECFPFFLGQENARLVVKNQLLCAFYNVSLSSMFR